MTKVRPGRNTYDLDGDMTAYFEQINTLPTYTIGSAGLYDIMMMATRPEHIGPFLFISGVDSRR